MDCRDITPLLSSHIDDELPAHVARAVADHVRTCGSCQSRRANLVSARDAVRQWPKEFVSPAFGEQLYARLRTRGVEAPPAVLGRSHRFGFSLAAIALAAVLLLILFPARRITAPAVSQPGRTSQIDEAFGIDCGLAYALRCHTEPLCSSAVTCGPSRTMPAFVDVN